MANIQHRKPRAFKKTFKDFFAALNDQGLKYFEAMIKVWRHHWVF